MRDERNPEHAKERAPIPLGERELFQIVLGEYPAPVHLDDLAKLTFASADIVRELIGNLESFGIVREGGGFVALSHAAIRTVELSAE